ncbi:hypothetical protein DSECCO2_568130 [anaerobic digester metagenome]
MRFRGKIDDSIRTILCENGFDGGVIADIRMLKEVARATKLCFDIAEAFQIAGIGEFIQIDDLAGEGRG